MNKTTVKFTEISDLGMLSGENETERSVEISQNISDLVFDEFMGVFIIPLLEGIGYARSTIDEYFGV